MTNKEIGRSKFTIGILTAFLIGLYVAEWIPLDLWWTGGIVLGLMLALVLFWREILWRWVLFCLLGLFFGLGYYYLYSSIQNQHSLVYNKQMEMSGTIIEPVQIKSAKTQAVLKYNSTKILVELPRYPEYQIGDTLIFAATIQDPRSIKTVDNFNYGQYLLDKNIRGLIKNPENVTKMPVTAWHFKVGFLKSLYYISDKFQESLLKILPEPYASFQVGLLLGNRVTQLPDSLTSDFNRTGTTHVVAVSGYNITIIISVLAMCFALFSRRWAFWLTLLTIGVFIVITGGAASVIRAGILGGLAAWGRLEGRRANHLILILVVAFIMLLFNPYQLKGDIGFQLSFLAFAGLIYISPIISELKIINKIPGIFKTVLSETMAAQVAVLPILIYNFGLVSLVAPVVNILILPVVPTAMALGFVSGLGGIIWLPLGKILALVSWLVLKYIIVAVEFFSRLSFAAVTLKTSEWWWIPLYYLVIFLLIRAQKIKAKQTLDKV